MQLSENLKDIIRIKNKQNPYLLQNPIANLIYSDAVFNDASLSFEDFSSFTFGKYIVVITVRIDVLLTIKNDNFQPMESARYRRPAPAINIPTLNPALDIEVAIPRSLFEKVINLI
jgi:hypothetical protein